MKAPASAANSRVLRASEFEDVTLSDSAYEVVASVQATRKKFYAHGYGTDNRNRGNTGFCYLDLQGDAASANGTSLEGTIREVVYHSSDHEVPKAILREYDLETLRASETEALSDREVMARVGMGASEDEEIVWEVRVDSDYDGDSVDSANSSAHIPYSEFRKTA